MATLGIIGPGNVGRLLGARFLRAGHRVCFLARSPQQARQLKKRGFWIYSPRPHFVAPRFFSVSHRASSLYPVDWILLCVKSHQVPAALRVLRTWPNAAPVLALQNGMAHWKILQKQLGPKRVLAGATTAGVCSKNSNTILHTGGNEIILPKKSAVPSRKKKDLQAWLQQAGWRLRWAKDEPSLLWGKLLLNACINPLGAIARKENGELARPGPLREILLLCAREASLILRKAGIVPFCKNPLQEVLEVCRKTGRNPNSLLQDLTRGKRTETDAILKPLLQLARKHRAPVFCLPQLYDWLSFLQHSKIYAGGRVPTPSIGRLP